MGNTSDEVGPREPGGAVGRRGFLEKVAVASTGAFAVPMISTVDPVDVQALTRPPAKSAGPRSET